MPKTTLDAPEVRALLDQPNYATVSTFNEDGTILTAVIWFGVEDGKLLLNSAKGRKWPGNLDRDPRTTVAIINGENPYEYVEVRGRVVHTTDEGAGDLIDALSRKYTGADYAARTDDRITYVVEPELVRHRPAH